MSIPSLDDLRDEVARRVSAPRRAHVEAVAETAEAIAAAGEWPADVRAGALRAAWIHDALKEEPIETWLRVIEEAGWEPDPWALVHGPYLLHADAAAAWARSRDEEDPAVLAAVRHHPTADPEWEAIGRILYVADFCEPTRSYAGELGTASLRERAGEGEEGLAEAAEGVLAIRLERMIRLGRPVHPRSWQAWNAWVSGREPGPRPTGGGP